jgi:hypothetical protein
LTACAGPPIVTLSRASVTPNCIVAGGITWTRRWMGHTFVDVCLARGPGPPMNTVARIRGYSVSTCPAMLTRTGGTFVNVGVAVYPCPTIGTVAGIHGDVIYTRAAMLAGTGSTFVNIGVTIWPCPPRHTCTSEATRYIVACGVACTVVLVCGTFVDIRLTVVSCPTRGTVTRIHVDVIHARTAILAGTGSTFVNIGVTTWPCPSRRTCTSEATRYIVACGVACTVVLVCGTFIDIRLTVGSCRSRGTVTVIHGDAVHTRTAILTGTGRTFVNIGSTMCPCPPRHTCTSEVTRYIVACGVACTVVLVCGTFVYIRVTVRRAGPS